MKRHLAIVLVMPLIVVAAFAGDKNPAVGGQEMLPTNNIMQNLSKSADHTTLVAAIKAAGLEETLKGPGPFTIFAPTNKAFAEQPEGFVANLMKPENKEQLKRLLLYHVVAGRLTTAELKDKIKEGTDRQGEVATLSGLKLHVADHNGMHLMVRDDDDDMGMFEVSNVNSSNGVIHVIDNVMTPK
jgi:uncharacterized surface protein with fasciclin (FAS1) repeats